MTIFSKIEILVVFTDSDPFSYDHGYWAPVIINFGRQSQCLPRYQGKLHLSNVLVMIKEQLTFCLNLFYVVNYMFQMFKFND